jgi:hypothetical protein
LYRQDRHPHRRTFLTPSICALLLTLRFSQINNCGFTGNRCQTPSFATGVKCSSGVCTPTACNAGYTLFLNQCYNLGNDLNNWFVALSLSFFPDFSDVISSTAVRVATSVSSPTEPELARAVCARSRRATAVSTRSTESAPRSTSRLTRTTGALSSYSSSRSFFNAFSVSFSGSVGKVCSYANGIAGCSGGSCYLAGCNSGFSSSTTYNLLGLLGSSTSCSAVDLTSDSNNCGAIGKVCTFANGAGSCKSGVCTYSSCSNGFYNVNNVCTSLNLQTDANNWFVSFLPLASRYSR